MTFIWTQNVGNNRSPFLIFSGSLFHPCKKLRIFKLLVTTIVKKVLFELNKYTEEEFPVWFKSLGVTFEIFRNVCCFFFRVISASTHTIRFLRERYPLPFAKQITLRGQIIQLGNGKVYILCWEIDLLLDLFRPLLRLFNLSRRNAKFAKLPAECNLHWQSSVVIFNVKNRVLTIPSSQR